VNDTLRVLIVDDEPIVRGMLNDVLDDAGFDIVGQACDGLEGVALARSSRPDAILLDVRMPKLDGLAAGRQIREIDSDVRLVFFSAYDDPALKQEAHAVGASTFLVKGCPLGEIVDALNGRDSRLPALAGA
jgi:two-component system chemotaxis response regulator CheY